MLKLDRKHLDNIDWTLVLCTFLLCGIGVVAIYSAGFELTTGESKKFYVRQIYWILLGTVNFILFSAISHKKFVKYAYVIYALGLLSLVIVLLGGYVGMGSRRWIAMGPLRIQPSEVFKLVWVIALSRIFYELTKKKFNLFDILKKSIWTLPPFLLIFLQPDLGTAGTFIIIWAAIIVYIGVKRSTALLIIFSMMLMAPLLWSQLKPYQKKRVVTFLNPEKDPFGSGYHVIQSKIAIGSGGLTGKGFLKGTQSHLKFVPERHTDFIFSVIAEEFGLAGGAVIFTLFIILLLRVMRISANAREPAGKIMGIAVATFIFFQFFINTAMTMGMMPVVGIPMPLISYGGSSMLTFMAMLGLMNGIAMRRYDDPGNI